MRNSSTYHKRKLRSAGAARAALTTAAWLCFCASCYALSPGKAISQYLRSTWGGESGFPTGSVYAIAQTPDGYLWIGTEKGLVRFDGLNFRLYQPADSPSSPTGPVLGLAVDGEGSLWVRVQGPKLLRYRDGALRDVVLTLPTTELNITAMCVGTRGDVLLAGFTNGLVRYHKGQFERIVPPEQMPRLVISLVETSDGRIWIGSREQGLFYLDGTRIVPVLKGLPDKKINAILETERHALWISTDTGLVRWDGDQLTRENVPRGAQQIQAHALVRDRDGNLWAGAANGLIRIDPKGAFSLDQNDKQGPQSVTALFEDREGDIWAGTARGIERLRDGAFTTYSVTEGLPSDRNGPVYVDADGRTWFGPSEGGLYWIKDGQVSHLRDGGLDKDVVYSIDGKRDELWVGRQRGGLTQIKFEGQSFTSRTYTQADGLAQNSVYAVHEGRDGSVWAGTISGGVSRLRNGTFVTYTAGFGLVSNSVLSILEGADGTMWFGTPSGLNSLTKGEWQTYSSREGLPPGGVFCLLPDATGAIWVGTANGLAYVERGTARVPSGMPDSLNEPIYGIEQDKAGFLWISTANHVVRVPREKILHHGVGDLPIREFDSTDGLFSTEGVKRQRTVAADALGRIWFVVNRGISMVDPGQLNARSIPAIVHLEGISADGRGIELAEDARIPVPHQRVMFSYAGLSLAVPERVRFKYRLDPFDKGWSEATAERQSVYTNLDSGKYQFHVIASNSDGVWNSEEAALQVELEPIFWQTWWFRVCCVAGAGLIGIGLLRLRVLRLTRELNLRFEERLAERTRIAQDLHDTLLQGFLSASMQLHLADERLSGDSPAKPIVTRVLKLMKEVIEEGRNTVQGLRSARRGAFDLEQAFWQVREDVPAPAQTGFRVIVEGTARLLRPVIREDVLYIGREALVNAFRHAQASHIEAEVEYGASHLRVLVRDDGAGIDPQVLQTGRAGHWGLSVMKERASRIGGKLRVLSQAGAGTEIELLLPSEIAFGAPSGDGKGWRRWPRLWKARRDSDTMRSGVETSEVHEQ